MFAPDARLAAKLVRAFDGDEVAIQGFLRAVITRQPAWETELLQGVLETAVNARLRERGLPIDPETSEGG